MMTGGEMMNPSSDLTNRKGELPKGYYEVMDDPFADTVETKEKSVDQPSALDIHTLPNENSTDVPADDFEEDLTAAWRKIMAGDDEKPATSKPSEEQGDSSVPSSRLKFRGDPSTHHEPAVVLYEDSNANNSDNLRSSEERAREMSKYRLLFSAWTEYLGNFVKRFDLGKKQPNTYLNKAGYAFMVSWNRSIDETRLQLEDIQYAKEKYKRFASQHKGEMSQLFKPLREQLLHENGVRKYIAVKDDESGLEVRRIELINPHHQLGKIGPQVMQLFITKTLSQS